MFARVKKSGNYQYVQVVHNQRVNGQVRQQVIATLGRLDVLKETGQLDQLLESLARLSDHVAVLNALKTNQITPSSTVHLGPPLVFEKLWQQLSMPDILRRFLEGRRFEFPVKRVVFLTVLHRLFAPGSDRAARALVPQVCFGGTWQPRSAALLSHDGLVRRATAHGPTTGWGRGCGRT